MTCCLTAPSHNLNQCWSTRGVLWHSHVTNFTRNAPEFNLHHVFGDYTFYITTTPARDQWVNPSLSGARWVPNSTCSDHWIQHIQSLVFCAWTETSCVHVPSCIWTTWLPRAGPWFNINMSPYQYRKTHSGDKTVENIVISTMGFPTLVSNFLLNQSPVLIHQTFFAMDIFFRQICVVWVFKRYFIIYIIVL